MRQKTTTLITAFLLSCSFWIGALADTIPTIQQPKLYQVEVIVFQHALEPSLTTSDTDTITTLPNLKNAIALQPLTSDMQLSNLPDSLPKRPYQYLPEDEFQLKRENNSLQKESGYQVLLHVAWLQPLSESQYTQPIHLFGGQAYNKNSNVITSNYENSQVCWQINGTLKLSLEKYITAQINLILTEPKEGNETFDTFQLKQVRRMKINELNYFDSPAFGVLIKVKSRA